MFTCLWQIERYGLPFIRRWEAYLNDSTELVILGPQELPLLLKLRNFFSIEAGSFHQKVVPVASAHLAFFFL